MKKVYGSSKADQKNRGTFMFPSFSALVVATYNKKLQKMLCDYCVSKKNPVTNLLPTWEKNG